jgi:hypothetical protein
MHHRLGCLSLLHVWAPTITFLQNKNITKKQKEQTVSLLFTKDSFICAIQQKNTKGKLNSNGDFSSTKFVIFPEIWESFGECVFLV